MVTNEEMKIVMENADDERKHASYNVTPEEMQRFKGNDKLPYLIATKKRENDEKHGVSATAGYDLIAEMCTIDISTLKKTINKSIRVTRTFLYKFTIGLHMTVDEANQLFMLCGGPLTKLNVADYICINYLENQSSIHDFYKQYEEYTHKKLR